MSSYLNYELWINALIIFQEGKSVMTSWVSYFITIKKKLKKKSDSFGHITPPSAFQGI